MLITKPLTDFISEKLDHNLKDTFVEMYSTGKPETDRDGNLAVKFNVFVTNPNKDFYLTLDEFLERIKCI